MSTQLEHRRQELRGRILDATLHLICERGMARTRTSAIAREAGCSEGSIYRYFAGKPELFHEVVRTRLSSLADVLPAPAVHVGSRSVEENLVDVVLAAQALYAEVLPLYAGLVADAELLAEQRQVGRELSPSAAGALVDYLRAEQRLGRVVPEADLDAVARLLLSSSLGETFACALGDGRVDGAERERRAEKLVRLVIHEIVRDGASS